MKYNFNSESLFEYKFGRKPKIRSLDEIHELYKFCLERQNKNRLLLSSYIKEIVNTIPANDNGEHIVYYYTNDVINMYIFKYNKEYKCNTIGRDVLKFSENSKGRDEKIDFILSNDKTFEMGDHYNELNKTHYNKAYTVFGIMWDIVEDKLRKHFRDINTNPKDVFIISLGSDKYYTQVDDQHRYGYMKFHCKGKVGQDIIEIK